MRADLETPDEKKNHGLPSEGAGPKRALFEVRVLIKTYKHMCPLKYKHTDGCISKFTIKILPIRPSNPEGTYLSRRRHWWSEFGGPVGTSSGHTKRE